MNSENIKVSSNMNINFEDYQKYFKYKIYECFKPFDLKQTRNYLEFLATHETDPNRCTVTPTEVSPELYEYLSKD